LGVAIHAQIIPLQLPPSAPGEHRADDRKDLGNGHVRPPTTDDPIGALKAYRRAQGLCYIFVDKWSPGHKCAASVQLRAVEVVFAIMRAYQPDEDD
jgi:hypothetical protein